MGSYAPGAKQEQQEMLCEIGYVGSEEMSFHILDEVMLRKEVNTPSRLSEQIVRGRMEGIAGKNVVFRHILRGAGACNHYVPAIISSATPKEEFVTVYTPYRAEINQGILQSIFEYQTMLRRLTGMDASNASIYDGATTVAEAIAMCKEGRKTTAYIPVAVNPGVIEVMKTYRSGSNTKVVMAPEKGGVTNAAVLEETLKADPQSARFYIQQPNYYGNAEDGSALGRVVHEAGAKYIMGCGLMALAVVKTPAEYGTDTAVGDGQPLGMPLALGGPYLGFMTATVAMIRKLPGRIVGKTADNQGRRAFVLTLQAREQHIRCEKVSPNVCSNQAWCTLITSIYMTATGADGMAKTVGQCVSKTHYLRDTLKEAGFELKYDCEFFYEFAIVSPEGKCTGSAHILRAPESRGILGGLPPSNREILWCATEMNAREEMDELASAIWEALHRECGQKEVCGS